MYKRQFRNHSFDHSANNNRCNLYLNDEERFAYYDSIIRVKLPSLQRTPKISTSLPDPSKIDRKKLISCSSYPIYTCYSQKYNSKMILKIFPHQNDKIDPAFEKEKRVFSLCHRNIISMKESHPKVISKTEAPYSYILMEVCKWGSFHKLLLKGVFQNDPILVRTYFRQLIDVIGHLHYCDMAHLDIKPENMLLDNDFDLKLTDFKSCWYKNEKTVNSRGSKNYRAPEIKKQSIKDPMACDIYSAGVVLFILVTGNRPYIEDFQVPGYNLMENMGTEVFWDQYEEFHGLNKENFDPDFRELFLGMTKYYPNKRWSIYEIKKSKWYQGEIYHKTQLRIYLKHRIQLTSKLAKGTS